MSKIRDLIIEAMHTYHVEMGYLENTETLKKRVKFRKDSCDQLEQAIKAEIMGLKPIKYLGNGSTSANGKYNDNFHPMTQTSGEPQHIKRSDLENLFKEDE